MQKVEHKNFETIENTTKSYLKSKNGLQNQFEGLIAS